MVKDLVVKVIASNHANSFVRLHHYSKKVVPNSQLHFGVFYQDRLEGVMQFGPPMRKHFVLGLVKDTKWNEMLELNRMAFSNRLPKNSESRCLGIALKMIKKQYPHFKWVLTFADGTQCGDGTIYRATNFVLTGIKKNDGIRKNPKTGEILTRMAAFHKMMNKEFQTEWEPLTGFQLRYIYFLKPECLADLTVPVLPFSKIKELGANMYLGKK